MQDRVQSIRPAPTAIAIMGNRRLLRAMQRMSCAWPNNALRFPLRHAGPEPNLIA